MAILKKTRGKWSPASMLSGKKNTGYITGDTAMIGKGVSEDFVAGTSGLKTVAVNGPPIPPIVDIVPYFQVNNKILFLLQNRYKLNKARKILEKTDYYDNWSKEYKQKIWRNK